MDAREVLAIRKLLGMTQAELAKKLGVARNTIARWEMGTVTVKEPTAQLLRLLAWYPVPTKGKQGHKEGQKLRRLANTSTKPLWRREDLR